MKKIKEEIVNLLVKASVNLLNERNADGNWGDVRSSALALLALRAVLSLDKEGKLNKIKKEINKIDNWLIDLQRKEEDNNLSWESEAWDTSLAIIALLSKNQNIMHISSPRNWLLYIAGNRNGVWYDEVWESTLTIIAFLRSYNIRGIRNMNWLKNAFKWFNSIPSKPSGEFVCPHYTGFLIWILGEIQNSQVYSKIPKNTIYYKKYIKKANSAYKWLFKKLETSKWLWSDHTFSNAYITMGFFSPKNIPFKNINQKKYYLQKIVKWFKNNQREEDGGFDDVEDTSLVILALCKLLDRNEEIKKYVENNFTKSFSEEKIKQKICFIGYCRSISRVAKDLKSFIERNFSDIIVVLWESYFKTGKQLFEEIKKICKISSISIFILSKDDKIISSKRMLPRDNVILEVGYFMAKHEEKKTLLIVEEDTKLPSDIKGIIHISLKDRNKLEDVKYSLKNQIEDILYNE